MAYRDDIDRNQYGRRYPDEDEYEREYRGGRTSIRGRYGREEPFRTSREERLRTRGRQEYGSRTEQGRYSREGWNEGYSDIEIGRGPARRLRRDFDEFSQPERQRDLMKPYGREGELGLETESEFDYSRERYEPLYGRRSLGQPRSISDFDEDRGWLDRLTDAIASWFGDEEAARRRRMDEQSQGERQEQYRGLGPKGYRRSDERIREDVNDRLTDNDELDATLIEVTVSGGEVILEGIVRDRFSKRIAEDLAERVSGVHNVENRLKVSRTMELQSEPQPQVTTPPASKATTTKGS